MMMLLKRKQLFNPSNLTGLVAWYRSRFPDVTYDGENYVSALSDLSNNNDVSSSGADRPWLVQGAVADSTALYFDGAQQMAIPSGLYSLPNGAFTIFIVARRLSELGAIEALFSLNEGTGNRTYVAYSSTVEAIIAGSRNSSGSNVTLTGVSNVDWNLICFRRSGTTQALSVNNGAETSNTSAENVSDIDNATLGAAANDTLFFQGYIAEMAFYNSSLSTDERTKLSKYFSNTYNITMS